MLRTVVTPLLPHHVTKVPPEGLARLQAWLRHMRREHWVPSCHQHLCSEHLAPSCFQWRWGARYLRPDAVPSIFSRVPPSKSRRRRTSRRREKPAAPPPPARDRSPALRPRGPASNLVHLLVLGPASRVSEAAATVLLTPLPLPPTPAGPRPGVTAQRAGAGLGAVLGALQRRVRRLQRRHARHQAQLRALEQLAQQLHGQSLLARARRAWRGRGVGRVRPGSPTAASPDHPVCFR